MGFHYFYPPQFLTEWRSFEFLLLRKCELVANVLASFHSPHRHLDVHLLRLYHWFYWVFRHEWLCFPHPFPILVHDGSKLFRTKRFYTIFIVSLNVHSRCFQYLSDIFDLRVDILEFFYLLLPTIFKVFDLAQIPVPDDGNFLFHLGFEVVDELPEFLINLFYCLARLFAPICDICAYFIAFLQVLGCLFLSNEFVSCIAGVDGFDLVALLCVNQWALETKVLGRVEVNLMHGSSIFMVFAVLALVLSLGRIGAHWVRSIASSGMYLFQFGSAELINRYPRFYVLGGPESIKKYSHTLMDCF